MTVLPRRSSCRASSNPIPLVPPVTSTVLLSSFIAQSLQIQSSRLRRGHARTNTLQCIEGTHSCHTNQTESNAGAAECAHAGRKKGHPVWGGPRSSFQIELLLQTQRPIWTDGRFDRRLKKRNGPPGPVFPHFLAEPEGFEPSMQVLPTYSLSRGAPSATRSQLREQR